ncbi:MAG: TIGR03621 family F420-dependent LLM class oxidoreductase [Acidimicrobiia bacterium]
MIDRTTAPIRFSIQIPDAPDAATWRDKVERAEAAGFYSLSVPDHIGSIEPQLAQLAPLVALGAAAMMTSKIRLAITVLDNDFRHPVMTAKEIATLDVLSNGRVDMGLGAGWLEDDYTRTGITTWDAPGVRVDRLFESIEVLRKLFAGGEVSHKGRFYELDRFTSYPAPLQKPVPLMIGAGAKRMLTGAAQVAQIVNIIAPVRTGRDTRRQAFEEQLSWIRDAGGLERDDLVLGIRVLVGVLGAAGESVADVAARVFPTNADEAVESPYALLGDLDAIAAKVLDLRARYGLTHFTVSEAFAWQIAPIVKDLSS